ncbi:MAG: hypothetical protein DCC75_08935, partial [Proteobacteria bacterium]
MIQELRNRLLADRGIMLILVAFFSVALLGFAALVVELGKVRLFHSQAQSVANAMALAILQRSVSAKGSGTRLNQTLERGRQILRENDLAFLGPGPQDINYNGIASQAAETGSSVVGSFRLGMMYQRDTVSSDAEGDSSICNGRFPCFIYNPTPPSDNAELNAAQVTLKVSDASPVLTPIARAIFGRESFTFQVSATATLVERCTAFLMDVSFSSFGTTHRNGLVWAATEYPPYYGYPVRMYAKPIPSSLYAMRADSIMFQPASMMGQPPSSVDCSNIGYFSCDDPDNFETPSNRINTDRLHFCSLPYSREWDNGYPWDGTFPYGAGDPRNYPVPPAPGATANGLAYDNFHYQEDYYNYAIDDTDPFGGVQGCIEYARWGPTFIDGYYNPPYYLGPQPFRAFMDGFNAALRILQEQKTAFDKVTAKAFVGQKLDEIPPFRDGSAPSGSFTTDLGYLVQITNYMNIDPNADLSYRFANPVRPNFLDHGWYPLIADSSDVNTNRIAMGSNLVEILDETINELSTECPAQSKKQIVMATDGIMTCSYATHDSNGNWIGDSDSDGLLDGIRNCDGTWDTYLAAEKQLLKGSQPSAGDWPGAAMSYPSILQRLQETEIALTILMSGDHVRPNFKNIADITVPNPPPFGPEIPLLEYLEAMALGFSSDLGGVSASDVPGYLTGSFFDHVSYYTDPNTALTTPISDHLAFANKDRPGYKFARPNSALGRLAMASGGLWCPLMDKDPTGNYQSGVLMNNRDPGTTQVYSTLDLSRS